MLNTFLGLGGTKLGLALAANIEFSANPFSLGIASGDVTDSSAILWTRLAPEPLKADGGMALSGVAVQWEISLDANMSCIIQKGDALATADFAHAVHVDVQGLKPASEYWYRFCVAGHSSQIGRTKTLPKKDSHPQMLRFVTTSCQNYTHGYFVAYQHMVADKPDFVIHLGDYIYDTSFGETFRQHETEQAPLNLAEFRRRHALYKTDKHLQHAHAQLPFFTMMDNHDAIEDMDADKFQQRAAYQAWYEHMPVRGYGGAGANHFALHRQIPLGDLLQINLLDVRQFRDKKDLCRHNMDPNFGFGAYRERCHELLGEGRSMLGQAQEQWLRHNLEQYQSAWNVIASPGPFLPFRFHKHGKSFAYIGAWDAYPANRNRIAKTLTAAGAGHPLILSGDVHSFWAIDGALFAKPDERIPVVEFISSSISANWPEPLAKPITDNLAHNPQVKFYQADKRGYLLHEVNKTAWTTRMRAMQNVKDIDSAALDLAGFVVKNGQPGLTRIY